ncbi:MAG: class I SAM-dependent methyltransferase [Congregibacter sp.]
MGDQEESIKLCRLCGGEQLDLVLDLGLHALSGVFPASIDETVPRGPLRLLRCVSPGGCGLVQLANSFDPQEMYGDNYGYRSGLNDSMVQHLQNKVQKIREAVELSPGDLVVDIGSNDGTTLAAYPQELALMLLGIDPSGEKFRHHYREDASLLADFFSAERALNWSKGQQARIVTSFSMLYDLEDPMGFAKDVQKLLCEGGIWVFEQSYLPSMLSANSYDTVCHEHLEYYALTQIQWMLDHAGFTLADVEFNAVNGGSFSVTAVKGAAEATARVRDALRVEGRLGLDTPAPYAAFAARTEGSRTALRAFIEAAQDRGERLAAIGASTKGNTLLQYCDIGADHLESIGEVNPDKFGRFTPGTHIPIVDEKSVLDESIDYYVVLPWHFRDFFVDHPRFKGRKLVFPLPELDVVTV